MSSDAALAGYWPSPWPGEDGGPRRTQTPHGTCGLGIADGERLEVISRDAYAVTMVVLRDPGEVYVLRHTLGPRLLDSPSTGWVERIDPESLRPLQRSPDLAAGPFWPGGLAAHANGSLYTVFGRWCHRLAPDCSVIASRKLPQPRPYNSFVILADGTIVTKDLDRKGAQRARLSLLEPESLQPRCAEIELPERTIARLSSDGHTIYVVGVTTVYRYVWDPAAERLERDDDWVLRYCGRSDHSYGWDPVVDGGQMWFLNNGDHTYTHSMLGAGVAPSGIQLIRVSLTDVTDHEFVDVCGAAHGSATNPPLYDAKRRIALGYDSANGALAAWRFGDAGLQRLWQRPYATATHMVRFGDTGEVVIDDYHADLPRLRTQRLRRLMAYAGPLLNNRHVRAAGASRCSDDVVVIDIETGQERARARVPSLFQGIVFPAVGWGRDLYYPTISKLARVSVV
ncbi:hypothetical protein [Mycobacterium decipiens]|uniref:Uncharacterized protein n=1 Tax=Mycobacterium decipiens TaxID=1430326 RepID=A0A1X2LQV8_9MYCO|nr:hypothetical protein [Mycobacterium decipiens]OSC37213.1 hypothetical protein B8W66_21745 [Mycobacterium decipiens]